MSKLPEKYQFLDLSDYGRPVGHWIASQLKSTFFTPSDDPYDFNTGKNIIGDGIIYDSQERTHKVNYKEFIALSKVMFCSFLGIELNDEQYESYLDFKCDERIYKILD